MIGDRFWATGIMVEYGYAGATLAATGRTKLYGWKASLRFLDDGWAGDVGIATEGTLCTRYFVGDLTGGHLHHSAEAHHAALTAAIDAIKADAERLGIEFGRHRRPTIYAAGDGEDPDRPLPDGWRELVNAQAERLGWQPAYESTAQGQGGGQ